MKTPWASIAKIEAGGKYWGTGFLVTENYVLTALHVVTDATGRPFQNIELHFNTGAERGDDSEFKTEAHIVEKYSDSLLDFALLECVTAPPSTPLGLSACSRQQDKCHSPGFALQKPSGFTVSGTILSLNDPVESGGSALGIQFDFGSGVLMKGHSGAPVLTANRVVGFLRTAFLDENNKTMGGMVQATPIEQVLVFCNRIAPGLLTYPINWPNPLPTKSRLLADRHDEFKIFEEMITGKRKERVFLLKGKSGYGKTELANELIQYARGLGLHVAQADCKGTPPRNSLIESLLSDLDPQILPKTIGVGGLGQVHKMIEDLEALTHPLLICLDTWQESSEDSRKWIQQIFAPAIEKMRAVVIMIGGQEIPEATATWKHLTVTQELGRISSAGDWWEYHIKKYPSPKITEQQIEALTALADRQGLPPSVMAANLVATEEGLTDRISSGGD